MAIKPAFSFDVPKCVAARLAPGQRFAYFLPRPFLLIVRTGRIVTSRFRLNQRVAPDTRISQHIARFYNGLDSQGGFMGGYPQSAIL